MTLLGKLVGNGMDFVMAWHGMVWVERCHVAIVVAIAIATACLPACPSSLFPKIK